MGYLERYLCKKNEIETKIMAETKANMWKLERINLRR